MKISLLDGVGKGALLSLSVTGVDNDWSGSSNEGDDDEDDDEEEECGSDDEERGFGERLLVDSTIFAGVVEVVEVDVRECEEDEEVEEEDEEVVEDEDKIAGEEEMREAAVAASVVIAVVAAVATVAVAACDDDDRFFHATKSFISDANKQKGMPESTLLLLSVRSIHAGAQGRAGR